MILPIWPTKSWIGALGERVETRLGLLGLPLGFIWVHLVLLVHPWFTVVSLSVHVGSTLDSLGCTCLVWCHLVSLDVTWFRVVSLGFHGLIWFGFNWFHCMVLDGRLRWYWMVLDGIGWQATMVSWFGSMVPWQATLQMRSASSCHKCEAACRWTPIPEPGAAGYEADPATYR